MSNRKTCAVDPTAQVIVRRLRTHADRSTSLLPHADTFNVREDRKALSSASRQVKIEETVLPVGPTKELLGQVCLPQNAIVGSPLKFSTQGKQLFESQQSRLHAERLADLIDAARSVSHDLRQYLAVLLANIEFLCETDSAHPDKDEIHREIRVASEQMIDLIDSLRALGSDGTTITPIMANLKETVRRALDAVNSRYPYRQRSVKVITRGAMSGRFDARKLERVFFNLVLNACEATTTKGNITVEVVSDKGQFRIRVCDDGSGVPAGIRHTLFEPTVSAANSNGHGFGLAVVKKIIDDHKGAVGVESTSESGTVIWVTLPRVHANSSSADEHTSPIVDNGEPNPLFGGYQKSA